MPDVLPGDMLLLPVLSLLTIMNPFGCASPNHLQPESGELNIMNDFPQRFDEQPGETIAVAEKFLSRQVGFQVEILCLRSKPGVVIFRALPAPQSLNNGIVADFRLWHAPGLPGAYSDLLDAVKACETAWQQYRQVFESEKPQSPPTVR